MKDLLAKLETATETEQEELILEALQYAYAQDWIKLVITGKAGRWVRQGAFLSAAMVLVPEGWLFNRMDQMSSWTAKAVKSPIPTEKWWTVELYEWGKDKDGLSKGRAVTAPLTVTIASLKAHDAQRTERSHP